MIRPIGLNRSTMVHRVKRCRHEGFPLLHPILMQLDLMNLILKTVRIDLMKRDIGI